MSLEFYSLWRQFITIFNVLQQKRPTAAFISDVFNMSFSLQPDACFDSCSVKWKKKFMVFSGSAFVEVLEHGEKEKRKRDKMTK